MKRVGAKPGIKYHVWQWNSYWYISTDLYAYGYFEIKEEAEMTLLKMMLSDES